MRTLILLRHAKAVKGSEAPSDEARALAPRGQRDAAAAGEAMREAGLEPALALISTAARTRETAAIALELEGAGAEPRFEAALYHASAQGIWDAFVASEAPSVVIVGHNPGMAELVGTLIAQAHDGSRTARDLAEHMPTAAWAAFEIRGDIMLAAGPRLIAAWKPQRDAET